MVCIPCIVIPVFLWIFHKFIQPFVLRFWNPWMKPSVTDTSQANSPPPAEGEKTEVPAKTCPLRNGISNGHTIPASGGDKKRD